MTRPGEREKGTEVMRYLVTALILLPASAVGIEPAGPDLPQVHRIHVERLNGDETADQIRDMIISALDRSGLFVLTENPERADAILRGSAEDLVYNETHEFRDGVDARTNISVGRSTSNRNSRGFSVNSGVGQDETGRSVERRHEALAAVRLVNRNGDVIWSTVQESRGAKLTSASADVADRVTRQLLEDYRIRERIASGTAPIGRPSPATVTAPASPGR